MDDCMVSVIMPVYNAETTIENSIQSVMRQKISSMELLCIDDGSEDHTIEKLENLAAVNTNIRVFRQNHSGAGAARNLGINEAKGLYIAFLDADDEFVDENALNLMIRASMTNNALICGSNRIVSENGNEKFVDLFPGFLIPDNGRFIDFSEYQRDYDYQSFIFERSYLLKKDIRFPDFMRYQDPPFFIKAMSDAKRFYALPVVLYKYRFNGQKRAVITRYMDHILEGILMTLHMTAECEYFQLFDKIRRRVDEEYRDAILCSMSDSVMTLLIKINEYSKKYDGKNIGLNDYIYRSVHEKERVGKSHYYLERIIAIQQDRGRLRRYLNAQGINSVAVYGLGKYGKILINELLAENISIVCAIDKKIQHYKDIRILSPDDIVPDCDAVIVSLLEPEGVMRELYGKIDRVIPYIEIIEKIGEEK